jgi:hypothetical protein
MNRAIKSLNTKTNRQNASSIQQMKINFVWMKSIVLFAIAMVIMATSSFGQTDTLKEKSYEKDTAVLKINNKEIIIIENKKELDEKFDKFEIRDDKDWDININTCWNKKFDGHYAGFELGLNNYLNKDMEMKVPADGTYLELDDSKSLEFSWNLLDISIPIVKHRLGLVTGLGFTWNNYKFDNKQLELQNDQPTLYVVEDTLNTNIKNKLTTWYMNVPLMLEFQQPVGSKTMYIAAGAYGGIKLGSHTKQINNDEGKDKDRNDYHLNTLRYGVRAQVGFDNFGLYCNYSLVSLFKTDEGPEVYPISMGVTLAF